MLRIIPDGVPPGNFVPETDVVVIGGGIVGVSTAFFLAGKGHRVVLCEKGLVGAEQSGRNWGWVRQMGRDLAEIPLAVRSLQLWRDLDRLTGTDVGFRQTGISYICHDDREMAEYLGWANHARDFQIDTRILDKPALKGLIPGISDAFTRGIHTPTDGRAEPWVATPAIARAAAARGAHILGGCAVRSLETEGGKVSGVITERGEIRCTSVVLAGGAWSRLFLRNLGIEIPILKVIGSVARMEGAEGMTDMPVGARNFAFRRRIDGGFSVAPRNHNVVPMLPDSFRFFSDFTPNLIASWKELRLRVNGRFFEELSMPTHWRPDEVTSFEQVRILDPAPKQSFLAAGIEALCKGFPAFRKARMTQSWGGVIDVTPDAVPIIDQTAQIPGLFVATGFSGHGFGIGPGAGEMMAQIISGETPAVDPAPFRISRFARAVKARAAA